MRKLRVLAVVLSLLTLVPLNPHATALAKPAVTPTIKVGLMVPLSGGLAAWGQSIRNGVDMAVSDAAGTVNVELVVVDDADSSYAGAQGASYLIDNQQVKAIIGSLTTAASLPVSEVAQQKGIVQISPTSTAPFLTSGKDYIFRACFTDPDEGTAMASFAASNLKAKTAAIMVGDGIPGSNYMVSAFEDAFAKKGGTITGTFSSDAALIPQVAVGNPAVVYLLDWNVDNVNAIITAARAAGMTSVFLGSTGWNAPGLNLSGDAGSYLPAHFDSGDPRPEAQAWVQKYQEAYGFEPDTFATLGYDAAQLLFAAVARAGTDDPAAVRDGLASTRNFSAASGLIKSFQAGNPDKAVTVDQVGSSGLQYYTTLRPW